ncbi:MAG TPA: MFS transporter [Cellulomonas sp.]|uniref:MFS transporter n=1 Tax=Cellulomonas sp. TaxID=40001 RepID=UPI002E30B3D8|nr:MFS transporter [Cellulomonas sp.]HEX5333080.1 MFS transporter [Cellulomonas sp.]
MHPAPDARRRQLILSTLCLALFMSMLDNVVVSNALPSISTDLHAGMIDLQWVMEGYSLVFASLLLLGGTLGDRLGRRRLFLVGLTLFTGGSLVCALAGTLPILMTGRVVQGVGAALLTPQSLAVLRVTFLSEVERARAIGTWSGVSALGLALGPAIGGPLVTAFGWASAFWINVPVGVAALALGARVLPHDDGHHGRIDLLGQVIGTAGVAGAVFALIEAPSRGWSSPTVLGSATLAVVGFALFVPVELRAERPMLDVRLFRDRIFAGAAFAGFVVSFGMFGVLSYLGLYMQSVLGWSAAAAGIASLPSTGVIMIAAPVASRMAARWGARLPLVIGLSLCATGVAILSRVDATASYADFWWALPLIGTGMGMSFSPITIAVMGRVPAARAGMASATTNATRELGGVAGIAIMGSLITARLASVLPSRLAAAGVPADVARRVVDTATAGGAGGIASSRDVPHAISWSMAVSFTDGLQLALMVAAVVLVLGAVAVFVQMRPEIGRPSVPAPGPSDGLELRPRPERARSRPEDALGGRAGARH